MKFGVSIPGITLMPNSRHTWDKTATPDDMLRIARKADELGYDYISAPEHIIMTKDFVANMGARWSHAVTTIAFFAGATKRIRLANSIIVVPYHHPVELAKSLATLDFLSGGRLIVGIGTGNNEKEFQIMKAPIKRRGFITDESMAAMIELWTSESPTFKGQFVQFDGIVFDPKPVQKPYPPIWVGGNTTAALKRAARIGDGWWPASVRFAQVPDMIKFLKDQPEFQKRPRPFDVITPFVETIIDPVTHKHASTPVGNSKQEILDQIGKLEKIGATATAAPIPPTRSVDEYLERMEWFSTEVFPLAKSAPPTSHR